MKTAEGKDLGVKVNSKSIYHSTEHSFQADANVTTWETMDTDGPVDEVESISGTVSTSSLVCVSETGDTDKYDTVSLFDAFLAKSEVQIAVNIFEATYTGPAIITNVSANRSLGQKPSFSATFKFNKLTKAK